MMKNLKLTIVLSGLLICSACSHKSIYQAIQSNQQSACDEYPTQDSRKECLQAVNKDYSDYKRERDGLLNKDEEL